MKFLMFFFVVVFSQFAHAEEQASERELLRMCQAIENSARSIMTARQNGRALSDILAVGRKLVEQHNYDPVYVEMVEDNRKVAIKAYEIPMFSVESNKQEAIMKFQNEAYLNCIKTYLNN